MNSEERRTKIIDILNKYDKPVSGSHLADNLNVSRQVIVQDIAILRAENKNIVSTNKGYMLYRSGNDSYREYLQVTHSTEQILDEFFAIVDNGGTILNVGIDHDLYGRIEADLFISNRIDAKNFFEKMLESKDSPLSFITDKNHFHLVETKNKEFMDHIKKALANLNFLIN